MSCFASIGVGTGERDPLIIQDGAIFFTDGYIDRLNTFMDTDDMSMMSRQENALTDNFINFEDGLYTGSTVVALDIYLSNEVNGIDNAMPSTEITHIALCGGL